MRTSGFRDELFLKLFGAARLAGVWRSSWRPARDLRVRAGRIHARAAGARFDDPLVALLLDAAIAHTKADLELLDTAPARLADITPAALAPPAQQRRAAS